MFKSMVLIALFYWLSFGTINKYWHVATDGTGGSAQGTTWAAAINKDTLEKVLEGSVTAGDVFFVKEGTYSIASTIDWSARVGTSTTPIAFYGVKSGTTHEGANVVQSDQSETTDRPLFSCGTNIQIIASAYNRLVGMQFTGTSTTLVNGGVGCFYFRCKFSNTSTSADRVALAHGNYGAVINCDLSSDSGKALIGSYGRILYNYFHDCKQATYGKGLSITGGTVSIIGNKFYRCTQAVNTTADHNNTFLGNTFFACGDAVNATTDYGCILINNVLDSCKANGFIWSTQEDHNFFWANHGDDARNADMWDGVDETTILKDWSVTTGDPLFVNPPDSLQLGASSPALNTGIGAK